VKFGAVLRVCSAVMRRVVIGVVLFLWACGGAAVRTPERVTRSAPPAPSTAAPSTADELVSAEIPSPCGDGARITLTDGAGNYASTIGLEAPGEIELEPIATTDLDGDGTAELIAYVLCMPGGSGTFDSVRAYHIERGRVVEVAAIEGGDRADGGLDEPRVVNGEVRLGRFSGDEAGLCCPTHVSDETWQLRAGSFVRTSVGPQRPVDP
jgi:hypothetical protein